MADLYQHDNKKFADAGLQLRVPVDLVPPAQYSRLTNAIPVIEGRLEARAGLSWIVKVANATSPGSGLHSLTRLNQGSVATLGDRVAGIDTTVQTFALPAGNVATSRDTSRSGDPLSLPTFKFIADTSAWQIVADRYGMNKYKGGPGAGYYQQLGIAPPSAQLGTNGFVGGAATAVDGGAGNLNNGSGPGYDWLYTYVNTLTQTESNPSSVEWTTIEGTFPQTITTPDTNFGGSAATSTGGGGGVFPTTAVLDSASATETRQSVNFSNWTAATFQYSLLYLEIQVKFTAGGGTTGGCAYGAIYMSLDGGVSWKLIVDSTISVQYVGATGTLPQIIIPLNPNQDLSKLQISAVALAVGNATVPQNVTARRIRQQGGYFNLASLLTGGGGNATMNINISAIKTTGVDIAGAVTTLVLANRKATVTVHNPVDTQVDAFRLYRRGGSVTAGWAFVNQTAVASHAVGTTNITDNVADANLGSFVNMTNDAPVTSIYVQNRHLPYIWGPGFNPSRLFGCGDPDRPGSVYFSNPGNADQWGVGQWVDVSSPSDPMQNGCIFNTRVFAFSMERMFELTPSLIGGATVTPFQTPCSRGLISPYGLVATARAIYFVAKDGIYMTTGGEEQSLVENDIKPLFPTLDNPTGRQIEGYDYVDFERIEDIRLRFHNDELYFIYRGVTTGALQMLVYDQNRQKPRWRAASYPVNITTVYSEEGTQSSLLLGDASGNMYTTAVGAGDVLNGSTSGISVTIRTGAFDQGQPLNQKEYGNVVFDLDPGGATAGSPITITPLINGETVTEAAITVTGSGRQQVPLTLGDIFGFNIEFQITYTASATIAPVLYQFDILWRLEPAAVTHWEARETDNGLVGWQHIRDMYVCLRSNTSVTLTCTFDNGGATYQQTYTIASTAGLRRKVYVPFQANKFKLVRYSFDSTDVTLPFRLYERDMEVRAKPYMTSIGYSLLKPFGGESSQAVESALNAALGGQG